MNIIKKIYHSSIPRGLKVMVVGFAISLASCLPLIVYILVGPSDGNPIGLGLLMVLGQLIALAGVVIGLIILVWDKLKN